MALLRLLRRLRPLEIGLLACAASCSGGPDELELTYNRIFRDYGGGVYEKGRSAFYAPQEDDSDVFGIGLTWKLKPTPVTVVNPVTVPDLRWTLETTNSTPSVVDDLEDAAVDLEEASEGLADAIDEWNGWDWLSRVLAVAFLGWIAWIFRERIAKVIPSFGGGSGKRGRGQR